MESKLSHSFQDNPAEKGRPWDAKAEAKARSSAGGSASKKYTSYDDGDEPAQAKHAASDSFDFAEEKERIAEIQQDIEADEEFEQLKNKPVVVEPSVARTILARNFVRGFQM